MSEKLYLKINRPSLRYSYYFFFDTTPYLADQIFIRHEIRVWFGQEFAKDGSPYRGIFCHVRKKDAPVFEACMEELKKNIGCVMQRPDMGIEEVKGRNLANGLPKTVRVSSNELIEAFVEPMNDILEAIHAVLERTPPQLVGDLDQNGIIISGGGSLVYGMDRLIERSSGIRTIPVDDPVSCATYGAGKMLKHLEEMQDGMMNFHRMRQLK